MCSRIMFSLLSPTASSDSDVSLHHEETAMEAAIKELDAARTKMKVNLLRTQQDIKRRMERADILASTGGSPGVL